MDDAPKPLSAEDESAIRWALSPPSPIGLGHEKASLLLSAHDYWRAEAERLRARYAPGHTDLMVPPESLDAFMEANPLPPDAPAVPTGWPEMVGAKAREYARHYPQSSDGRNTFIMFAEWVEALAAPPPPAEGDGETSPPTPQART